MTTFNTNNPIGSSDPEDLFDNAENLDNAMNDTTSTSWVDRLGISRATFYEVENRANAIFTDTQTFRDEAQTAATNAQQSANEASTAVKDYHALKDSASLDLNFARGKYLVDGGELIETTNAQELLTVERASPKWVEGPNGKLREVPLNVIARQWKDGKPQGALIEESRTNLLLWSEDASQEAGGTTTLTADAIESPRGTVTGDLVEDTSGTNSQYWQAIRFGVDNTEYPPGTYTGSLYIKKYDSRYCGINFQIYGTTTFKKDAFFDFDTGSLSTTELDVEPLPNGWFRVFATVTTTDSNRYCRFLVYPATSSSAQDGSLTGGVYVWGAQLEEGSTPSSYIPTTDSPVTRAADNVSRVLGDEFNQDEGTVFWEGVFPDNLVSQEWASIIRVSDDLQNFTDSFIGVQFDGGAFANLRFFWRMSGSSSYKEHPVNLTQGEKIKLSVSYKIGGNYVFTINGHPTESAAFHSEKAALSRLGLGTMNGAGGTIPESEGPISMGTARYIPRALTEQELIDLTS